MHHNPTQAFLVAALLVVVLGILLVLIRSRVQEHFFAGPRRDEWQQARRQLRRIDRWRVIWATRRNQPVSHPTLADAQLAYVRYVQDAAQRAPLLRSRRLRAALPPIFGVVAAGYAALAIAQSHLRIVNSLLAACFASNALTWGLTVPRSVRRLTERMARLRAEIERAPGCPGGPLTANAPHRQHLANATQTVASTSTEQYETGS